MARSIGFLYFCVARSLQHIALVFSHLYRLFSRRFLGSWPVMHCAFGAISGVFRPIEVPVVFHCAAIVPTFHARFGVAVERCSIFRTVVALDFHYVVNGSLNALELRIIVQVDIAAPEKTQQMAVVFANHRTVERPRCLALPALSNAVLAEAASH